MALGGGCSGLTGSEEGVGGGHVHIWPQCGEFSTNVRGKTVVHCRGIRVAKRRTSRASRVAGSNSGTKVIRDYPGGGP